jgi:hypothetical protein
MRRKLTRRLRAPALGSSPFPETLDEQFLRVSPPLRMQWWGSRVIVS